MATAPLTSRDEAPMHKSPNDELLAARDISTGDVGQGARRSHVA